MESPVAETLISVGVKPNMLTITTDDSISLVVGRFQNHGPFVADRELL